MKTLRIVSLLLSATVCGARPDPAAFSDSTITLPPLTLHDALAQPDRSDLLPPASKTRRSPSRAQKARPLPPTQHRMRVIPPDPSVDHKMLVQQPDPSIDYKMLLRETEAPADALAAPAEREQGIEDRG
jgi:hypothetical protein